METLREGSARIPTAISLPHHWMNAYGEFITKNASAVSQIESGLRSLTYVIPGRFRESEIASESRMDPQVSRPHQRSLHRGTDNQRKSIVHSGVQLLSLYHDSLLAKAVACLPALQRPHPTPHNRYTKFWTQKSLLYRRTALLLQMIQYTELLWEMAAKRRGEKVRWRVVVLLEAIKAVCRLLLLRLTNSRPLLSPPLPEREVDPSTLEDPSASQSGAVGGSGLETPPSEKSDDARWTMPRTGLALPSLPDSSDISTYLLSKVLTADDVKPPKALLHRATGKGEIAEWMYILRPVIFALAMQHWNGNRRNWRPWLIGLSIEYGARQLAKRDFQERFAGGLRGLTGLEKEELRKRGWSMGWWFMRGAFYENITRSWIQSIAGKLKGKPLLDMVGIVVEDYEFLWDQYYFPTATM